MDASDATEGFDYPALLRGALLDVVRRVLAQAAKEGLPGEHHFYLTFGTGEEGVELAPRLRRQYPDEMTIVLQHQFWGLSADDTGFTVTLRFGGAAERLVVPWTALRSFADPSVGFGLQLRPAPLSAATEATPQEAPVGQALPAASAAVPSADAPADDDDSAADNSKVVDLGAFRRRSDG